MQLRRNCRSDSTRFRVWVPHEFFLPAYTRHQRDKLPCAVYFNAARVRDTRPRDMDTAQRRSRHASRRSYEPCDKQSNRKTL